MKKSNWLIAMAVLLLTFCGCEMFREQKKEEKKKEKKELTFLQKGVVKDPNTAKKEKDEVVYKTEQFPGLPDKTLKAMEQKAATPAKTVPASTKDVPYYEDFILMDADQSLAVSLVFNSAPVLDVIPAFADVLGFNFVSDAELKNTVTLNINSNMTKRELWQTFDRMLNLAGATVRVDGSMLRIIPISKMARQSDLNINTKSGKEVCYYPLKNTTAKDVINQLKPFLSKDAAISELTRPNAILLSDSAENVKKLQQISYNPFHANYQF